MVERAINAAIEAAPSYWRCGDAQKDLEREQFGKVVRAVLEATREPTEAMALAGWYSISSGHPYQSDLERGPEVAAWQAMIDAALSPG